LNLDVHIEPLDFSINIINNNKIEIHFLNYKQKINVITAILDKDFKKYVIQDNEQNSNNDNVKQYCQLSSIFPDQVIEVGKVIYINYSRNDLYTIEKQTPFLDETNLPIYKKEVSTLSVMSILSTIGIYYRILKNDDTLVMSIIQTLKSLSEKYKEEDISLMINRVQNGNNHQYLNIFNDKYPIRLRINKCDKLFKETKLNDDKSSYLEH